MDQMCSAMRCGTRCFFVMMILPWHQILSATISEVSQKTEKNSREDEFENFWLVNLGGFRSGHHLYMGTAMGLPRSSGWLQGENGRITFSRPAQVVSLMLDYSFHIPLYKSFGYYLGSRLGLLDAIRLGGNPSRSHYVIALPGLRFGWVYNLSQTWRVHFDASLGALRYENYQPYLESDEKASMTAPGVSLGISMDWFWSRGNAFRFAWEMGSWRYSYEDRLRLDREERTWHMGYVRHFY